MPGSAQVIGRRPNEHQGPRASGAFSFAFVNRSLLGHPHDVGEALLRQLVRAACSTHSNELLSGPCFGRALFFVQLVPSSKLRVASAKMNNSHPHSTTSPTRCWRILTSPIRTRSQSAPSSSRMFDTGVSNSDLRSKGTQALVCARRARGLFFCVQGQGMRGKG